MSEKKSKSKLTTQTSLPLFPALPPVDKEAAVENLLDKLYELAVNGDLSAAKLYLDYRLKRNSGEPAGLTVEEALKLLSAKQESAVPETQTV
ncbi:hypothetical protein EHM69_04270 [candidate division KSB1 bacterium]|nr:MAG: hypothetical protein EHM69_04270 [candidate division KSB1 bacterium]